MRIKEQSTIISCLNNATPEGGRTGDQPYPSWSIRIRIVSPISSLYPSHCRLVFACFQGQNSDLILLTLQVAAWQIKGLLRSDSPIPAKVVAIDPYNTLRPTKQFKERIANLLDIKSPTIEDRTKAGGISTSHAFLHLEAPACLTGTSPNQEG
jgi:hypothetical protein